MKRPSMLFAVAALAALLLPTSARCAVPTDNPALTALLEEALINVQCEHPSDPTDGITINTGLLSLGDGGTDDNSTNGLVSDSASPSGTVVELEDGFIDAWNPGESRAVDLDYCPYVAAGTLMTAMREEGLAKADDFHIPEWTVSTRVMMPEYEDSVVLALGENHSSAASEFQALGTLVVTTGSLSSSEDDRNGDELILWYISDGNYSWWNATNTITRLGSVSVPCLTDSFHLLTVRCANRHVDLFLNDRLMVSVNLPDGEPEIAPGLQYGKLMGDISSWFGDDHFNSVTYGTSDGGIDFCLFYDRPLDEAEIYTLARAYPYIHKDDDNNTDVRYVRSVTTSGAGSYNWVAEGQWKRQYLDGGTWTNSSGTYAEPAEGSIVAIQVSGGGTATFDVNTQKGGLFPSADRTYAQLEVFGEGTVKIGPCSGWETAKNAENVTLDPTRVSGYQYGTLYFTGSANDDLGLETVDHNATATGIFRTNAEVAASVCDFSNDIVLLRGGPTVTFLADEARVRGLEGPVVKCQLTQEISGESGNRGTLGTNASVNPDYGQVSEAVDVPTYEEDDAWLITDKTKITENGQDVSIFSRQGLVAWYFKQIEPIYLDLADVPESAGGSESEDEHAFSKQPWRRGGYDGEQIAEDEVEEAFQHAARLNVRLVDGKTVSPLIVNAAKRAKSLTVELPDGGAKSDVLRLVARNGLLTLSETLDVDGTLRVFDYDKAIDAVTLLEGATLTGTGVFAACNTTFSDLKEISIDTIRSEGLLTFGQDVPNTTLAAAGNATLATTAPNRQAKALNLNAKSILDCTTATAEAPAFTVETVEATLPVRVKAPDNAFHGLVFLHSEEKTADMHSREAFQAAHKDGDKWDIRLDVVENGSNFFFDEAGFAEPTNPTDGIAGEENTWAAELEETLIDIYQSENLIGGEAEGYTQGKEKVLSASDISDALLCFRNVAALATHGEGTPSTRAAAAHSDDYAAVADLIVAYEFGISRATIVKDEAGNEQVLVEVTLRNDLATDFADRVDHIKDPSEFTNADKTADIETATPAYAEGTTLVFSVNNVDIKANQVTEEALPAEAAAGTSLTRRFRIPLSAFPAETADADRLEFSVRAIPPEMTPEAQADLLKSLF